MITIYQLDAQGVFIGEREIDPMGPLPLPLAMTAPPETTGDQVARWNGSIWEKLAERPVVPDPSAEEVLTQARAAMVISPMQGILTLGKTEWTKITDYRDRRYKNDPDPKNKDGDFITPWEQRVIIDSALDWRRDSQNIAFFGFLLGYTPEELDALFIAAAKVEV